MGQGAEEIIVHSLIGAAGYLSGEEMARQLGVSRTAVWNHVNALKRAGFGIESHPHLGYRLSRLPDALLPAVVSHGLKTDLIGRRMYHHDRTTSTSDEAERLAREGEPEGAVVIAEEQTAGRGRVGRPWVSPRSKGIYLSIILRPALPPGRMSFLTLCSAISATEAIRSASGLAAALKWPNDVLISGRKSCGILTELATEADRIIFAIVGVGLNVNHTPDDLRGVPLATSLAMESGRAVSRLGVVRAFLEAMERNYRVLREERYREIIDRWLGESATIGRQLKVESFSGERWEGVATGLDDDGCLLLRLPNGMTKKITGGDVSIL